MSLIFVWYAVLVTFLTNCKLFHPIRDLIEFAWHISHSARTPSTSRARKMQNRNAFETRFFFHLWGNTMYLKSRQEHDLPQLFQESKKQITRK